MQKAILMIVAAVAVVSISSGTAHSGSYAFGDPPYRLDFGYDPQVESGCLKWNWQQYQWDDFCAVYVHPKAYMYPRAGHAVLRVRG
jgi:hypothetical protein